jgi:hypothetical protein
MFGTVPIMTAIVAVLWPTIITTYESCSQRVIVAHSALTRPGARRCATYPKALPPSDEVLQQPDTDCRVADKFQARSFVPHLANQLKTGEHAANAYTLHLSRTHCRRSDLHHRGNLSHLRASTRSHRCASPGGRTGRRFSARAEPLLIEARNGGSAPGPEARRPWAERLSRVGPPRSPRLRSVA